LVEISKSAEHSTVAGLIRYGYEEMKQQGMIQNSEIDLSQSFVGISQKMKNFFKDLF
jgi:hypothetical protein